MGVYNEQEREEQIIKYRPMVYWLVQKLNAPQDIHLILIEEGMTALISFIDDPHSEDQSSGAFQMSLYNKVRNKMLAKMLELERPVVSPDMAVKINNKWSIDLEKTLLESNIGTLASASQNKGQVVHGKFLLKLKAVLGFKADGVEVSSPRR